MNNNLTDLQNLLYQVENIVKNYDDLALQSGEKFNVFDIIGLRNDEVRMHSRFIGELLNPNGTHNQGGVFLKLFLDIVNKEIYNTSFVFDINNFKIVDENIIERFIGQTNVSKTNGGRIDLILESDNQVLIIENKIFAKNQENQLIRYTNYARKLNKEFYVFYLTINENWIIPFKEMKNYNYNSKNLKHIDNPGSYEEFIKDNKYKNCSFYTQLTYNNHILNWLDKCKKNKTNNELLNNGIEFYINLLNILTNQTMEDKRTNDIINSIIENPNFIDIYFEIFDENFANNLKSKTISIFIEKNTKIRPSYIQWIENRSEKYINILTKNNINLCLSFEDNFEKFKLGLYSENVNISNKYKKTYKENKKLSNLKFNFKNPDWICFKEIEEWKDYKWSDLLTNKNISGIFKENFKALKEVINEISN